MTKAPAVPAFRSPGAPTGWGWERILLVAGALGLAATATASILLRSTRVPFGLFVAMYVLMGACGTVGLVAALRVKRSARDREWTEKVRNLLAVGPGAAGALPIVRHVTPYDLGVSPSRYACKRDPYVLRDADGLLRQALDGRRSLVLVYGDSKAGKSRAAYEAARHACADRPIVVPRDVAAIDELLALDPPLLARQNPALLWLDDVTESTLAALTPSMLDQLRALDVVTLCTMRSEPLSKVADSSGDVGRTARAALSRAEPHINLPFALNEAELRQARAEYPEEVFSHSIGEPLIAAEQLLLRFDGGRLENALGVAVVQVATDARRAGIPRPLRLEELKVLCPAYLAEIRSDATDEHEDYVKALAWACKPVVSHVSMVIRTGLDGQQAYVALDYLAAVADGQGDRAPRPIPQSFWSALGKTVSTDEAVSVGVAAYIRREFQAAQDVWSAVIGESPQAAFNLGLLQQDRGELDAAVVAYQSAIDSADPEWAPRAAFNLGVLQQDRGELDAAVVAYQSAIDSADRKQAPKAASNLGLLQRDRGEFDAAVVAYQSAIDSADPEWAPRAAFNLGVLQQDRGELDAAVVAYQSAIDSADPEWAPKAAFNLGVLQRGAW